MPNGIVLWGRSNKVAVFGGLYIRNPWFFEMSICIAAVSFVVVTVKIRAWPGC